MGAWIEIYIAAYRICESKSHPTMGAWIEIVLDLKSLNALIGRTPRWVRGLKLQYSVSRERRKGGRTPRWVRGLKLTPLYSHHNCL